MYNTPPEKVLLLTDYLSRHPTAYDDETEAERANNEQSEIETEEEYVIK